MENSKYGKYIVLDGPDGGGKSTIAKQLVEWFQKKTSIQTVYTRHPGSTLIGRELRQLIANPDLHVDPQTRALLFAADNSSFITNILKPKLEQGTWIISDRNNYISSLAYQIADGCSLDQLDKIHAATYPIKELPKIDLLLIMQTDYKTAYERRAVRSASEKSETYEKKMADQTYFNKIANAYNTLVEKHSDRLLKFVHSTKSEIVPIETPRCLYIDATRSAEEVFADTEEAIKSVLHESIVKL